MLMIVRNRKRFKNRNQMLHFVASTDYEDDVLYYTDGGATWFYNNSLYRNNNCVGFVDRTNEQVCRNISLGENTSLWRFEKDLFDAFKHYKPVDLTTFSSSEALSILEKTFISMKAIKSPSYSRHKQYATAFETVLFLSCVPEPTKEMAVQYKKSLKFVKDEDKRNEKARKEREKKQKAFDKKCFEISKKYSKSILKGKDWNEKLINFCARTRKVYITAEEWKELDEFLSENPFYCSLFNLASPEYGYIDGYWKQTSEYPEHPYINFTSEILNHLKGLPNYADFLYIHEGVIKTTRGVCVDDSKGLVRNLLKKFIESSDEDRQKFIGLHVGSFVIREWNREQHYLQVGCHRFYEQTLTEFNNFVVKEFADYCEKGK